VITVWCMFASVLPAKRVEEKGSERKAKEKPYPSLKSSVIPKLCQTPGVNLVEYIVFTGLAFTFPTKNNVSGLAPLFPPIIVPYFITT